jgi:hypothetical protein
VAWGGADVGEDVAFVGVAGEDEGLGAEFGGALEDGFVEGAGDTGGGAGEDEVDAGVAGVGEFVSQDC